MKLSDAKRVVIKVGTSTLTHQSGLVNLRRIERFVKTLSDLKNMGKELVLVTSGAIGVGVGKLGLPERPRDTRSKQAAAAVGQVELMYIYDRLFSEYNHTISQVLLTRDVVEDASRCQHCKNTLTRLLEYGVLPVVNENDTVAVEEIEFGDNDTLSAVVATLCEADLLLILTDIDGLYDKNPREHPDAKLLTRVEAITDQLRSAATGAGTALGTGGMITKLQAAELAGAAGIDTILLSGERPEDLYRLLDGESVGTYFSLGNKEVAE